MTTRRAHSPARFHFRMSWLAVALAAMVITAGTAGCGREDAAAATKRLDACILLTGEDVAAVLGTDVSGQRQTQQGEGEFWMSQCLYDAETAGESRMASLLLRPHHSSEGAKKAYADYEEELTSALSPDARLAPVEGLGEAAGWQDFGTSLGQLIVFDGPYHLILMASEVGESSQLSNAQRLAEQVLHRLHHQ